MDRVRVALSFLPLLAGLAACGATERSDSSEDDVRVDTRDALARRQYDAYVAFASSYTPRCTATAEGRPRVLVTGFGRFMDVRDNATGRIVSALVPSARYPMTSPPAAGAIDPPDAQLSVGSATIDLPGGAKADVCGMVLPVAWDLAAILVAKEVDAFSPSFVLMNGVADSRQPLWIELGAINQAAAKVDGSDRLRPVADPKQRVKLVDEASDAEEARGNLLSWNAVARAASEAITRHSGEIDKKTKFGDIVSGVAFAGFPRSSNTYLCNGITYATGYLMSHPKTNVRLLRAEPPLANAVNYVDLTMKNDASSVPRVFVHWPKDLADKHHAAGAEVMKAIIAAQLTADEAPTLGDNSIADPTLASEGDTF